jgi:hypothetical protein
LTEVKKVLNISALNLVERDNTSYREPITYINSKELRQAWNKRLQAELGGDTFWAALKMQQWNPLEKGKSTITVRTFDISLCI